MGLKDRLENAREQLDAGDGPYRVEVNRGDVNVGALTVRMNQRAADGWRLHTALAHDGNLLLVWEADGGT